MGIKFEWEEEKYKFIVIGILLACACFLTYYFHVVLKAETVFTHFFYFPIILAALWWKRKGVVVAFFLAAVLVISYIFRGAVVPVNDYPRALMFIVVAFVVATLSERIAKAEATKLAYAELDQIFNTVADGLRLIDKDFNVLRLNETFLTLAGISRDEVMSKKCYEVFHSHLCRTPGCPLIRILDGEERVGCEVEKERIDGTRLPGILTTTPFWGPDGKLIGIVEDFKDITERKRAEEELRASEKQLRETKDYLDDVIESSADAIVVVDMEGIVREWNKGAEDYMGYTADEVVGTYNKRFFADPEEAERIIVIVQREGVLKNHRTIVLNNDKKPVHISLSAALLKDKNGVPIGTVRVSRDITKEMELEERIKKERDNLNLIFESMVDGVYVVSEDYEIEFMNKVLRHEFGDQVGSICYKAFHNREEPCPLCKSSEVMKGKTKRWEWHSRRINKTYDLIETPLRNLDGTISKLTLFRDITMQKRAEKELKSYTKELEQANRDLEDFTVTVSHDLRAPLRTIQGFSMLLVADYADTLDETGRDYLNQVNEAVERMNALIEDLLKLSRVGRKFTELKAVDMNVLLEELKCDLRARIKERGGEVVVVKLPTVSTQHVWLRELFTNLIDNGLKFNNSETPTVEVSCEETGENYLFKVKDNGIGIEEKYQANIFKLFERLHTQLEYEGTGAGLAICKKVVEKLGGAIWVESKPGEGSTFFFTIPRN